VRSGGKARGTWLAVRGYLDQHCDMALERADVARAFGVTPGHISRLLKRFGNAGFAGALRQMRLARARMLLESSRLTVSEIAYRCGFSSPTYFVRVFRRDGGVPPGEYRRRVAAAGCMEL
jgi:AraC-like DNA-binding protein